MTFDDDFCLIHFEVGQRRIFCKTLRVSWPPPEILNIEGFKFKRHRYSVLTDKDRNLMVHVCRGAEYYPEKKK